MVDVTLEKVLSGDKFKVISYIPNIPLGSIIEVISEPKQNSFVCLVNGKKYPKNINISVFDEMIFIR